MENIFNTDKGDIPNEIELPAKLASETDVEMFQALKKKDLLLNSSLFLKLIKSDVNSHIFLNIFFMSKFTEMTKHYPELAYQIKVVCHKMNTLNTNSSNDVKNFSKELEKCYFLYLDRKYVSKSPRTYHQVIRCKLEN